MGSNINKKIGIRIHNARKNKKMSMKKLGELVNLHESTISRYEKGEIMSLDIEKLKEFAKALDVTPAYLMGWTQEDRYNIGNKLKELRHQKNKAIYEMAKEIEIDPRVLEQYENGTRKIPHEILEKIAIYFNISINDLIHVNLSDNENKASFITTNETQAYRQSRWYKETRGFEFNDKEADLLLEVGKFLMAIRNTDEYEKKLDMVYMLIQQLKK